MTLQSLTKIDRCGLNTASNYRVGIITATQFYKADVDIDKVLFVHYAGFSTNTTVGRPRKIFEIFSHEDGDVPIDDGVTLSIDDDAMLVVTDKTDFDMNFFTTPDQGTNLQKNAGFDDNIRAAITTSITLAGKRRVAYSQIPTTFQTDVALDIDSGVTVDVTEGTVRVI